LRVVDVREKAPGWEFDALEVEAVMPDVLPSACLVSEAHRTAALAWMAQEIARQGGSPEAKWRANGKQLGKIDDLLRLTRARLTLERAAAGARAGRCPFWMEPDERFAGRQSFARRWFLGVESGGGVNAGLAAGTIDFGPSGSVRALGGHGVGETWSLMAGIEGGGGARLTEFKLVDQQIPPLDAFLALPVVGRRMLGLSAHLDLEAAAIAYIDRLDVSQGGIRWTAAPGIRLGAGVGGSYVRLRLGAIPTLTFMLEGDYVPGSGGRPAVGRIGITARAGAFLSR